MWGPPERRSSAPQALSPAFALCCPTPAAITLSITFQHFSTLLSKSWRKPWTLNVYYRHPVEDSGKTGGNLKNNEYVRRLLEMSQKTTYMWERLRSNWTQLRTIITIGPPFIYSRLWPYFLRTTNKVLIHPQLCCQGPTSLHLLSDIRVLGTERVVTQRGVYFLVAGGPCIRQSVLKRAFVT